MGVDIAHFQVEKALIGGSATAKFGECLLHRAVNGVFTAKSLLPSASSAVDAAAKVPAIDFVQPVYMFLCLRYLRSRLLARQRRW